MLYGKWSFVGQVHSVNYLIYQFYGLYRKQDCLGNWNIYEKGKYHFNVQECLGIRYNEGIAVLVPHVLFMTCNIKIIGTNDMNDHVMLILHFIHDHCDMYKSCKEPSNNRVTKHQ